jgi:hypothetical protein
VSGKRLFAYDKNNIFSINPNYKKPPVFKGKDLPRKEKGDGSVPGSTLLIYGSAFQTHS